MQTGLELRIDNVFKIIPHCGVKIKFLFSRGRHIQIQSDKAVTERFYPFHQVLAQRNCSRKVWFRYLYPQDRGMIEERRAFNLELSEDFVDRREGGEVLLLIHFTNAASSRYPP